MLAHARTHGVYDALHLSEIGAWLADAPTAHFDVVVAADVFIYIGALESVFLDVARTLRPGGWLVFLVEETTAADYALQRSGRFAQLQAYIARLAGTSFTIVAAVPAVIRKESGVPLARPPVSATEHTASADPARLNDCSHDRGAYRLAARHERDSGGQPK